MKQVTCLIFTIFVFLQLYAAISSAQSGHASVTPTPTCAPTTERPTTCATRQPILNHVALWQSWRQAALAALQKMPRPPFILGQNNGNGQSPESNGIIQGMWNRVQGAGRK